MVVFLRIAFQLNGTIHCVFPPALWKDIHKRGLVDMLQKGSTNNVIIMLKVKGGLLRGFKSKLSVTVLLLLFKFQTLMYFDKL